MTEVNTHHKPLEDVAREKLNYHAVIPWHTLKKHLEKLEKKTIAKFRTSFGDDMLRIQGEMRLLDRLMNLPEALTLGEEDDPKGP